MLDRSSTTRARVSRANHDALEARVGAGAVRARKELESSDERLLAVVATDPRAFAVLYERYANLVYGRALAILGCREDAQDLTHEVFLSVCGPTSYDRARGTVAAFLITMARSRAIDRLRQRTRSARLLSAWHADALPTRAPRTPFDAVSMQRAAERVRAVLADLPGRQRRVLEMTYYDGLSQSEIAADLGTPLGTVKTLSRRAMIALSRALAPAAS